MTRSLTAGSAALLLLLPLVTGCGNKVTAPAGVMTVQTADDLAIQTVTGLAVVSGDVVLAMGSTPAAQPAGARRASPARAAWDTTVVWNGITYEASRTFHDALDNETMATQLVGGNGRRRPGVVVMTDQ